MQKFVPLFKEWTRKIIIAPVIQIIPLIRPPAFLAINSIRRVFWKIGNHVAFAKIALALIEIKDIKSSQSSLQATLLTKSRRRDFDFFVKAKIFRLDCEILLAVLTIEPEDLTVSPT